MMHKKKILLKVIIPACAGVAKLLICSVPIKKFYGGKSYDAVAFVAAKYHTKCTIGISFHQFL